MNRGPQSGRTTVDHVTKANLAWGDPPDWVIALAEACTRTNQSTVARQLNYSPATVSQVLSNSYGGDIGRVEEMVRGALLAETVMCPVMGELARNVCLSWQRKPFATTNAHRVRMHQACRNGCTHSRIAHHADEA